jgi:hypothetical protein
MRIAVSLGILTLVLASASSRSAAAQDGLHEQLAALTRDIERRPQSAQLYLRRAEL